MDISQEEKFSLEKIMKELNQGYVFEFMYMEKEHKIMGLDKKTYTIYTYTQDNYSNREEKQIVSRKVLREMYKNMTNITYSY